MMRDAVMQAHQAREQERYCITMCSIWEEEPLKKCTKNLKKMLQKLCRRQKNKVTIEFSDNQF
jgi:hypothetical protein